MASSSLTDSSLKIQGIGDEYTELTKSKLYILDSYDYAELTPNHLRISFDDYPYIELIDRNGDFHWRIKNSQGGILSFEYSN